VIKCLLQAHQRCRFWEKARMQKQDEMIKRLIDLESDIRYQEYAGTNDPEYLHVAGILPILISAPHGAVHTRNGDKDEDEYTAGMARLIGDITGARVIYARRKSRTDPNADSTAPYKQALRQIVHENDINFVLDLHGAKKDRKFGIALGTMHGKSCPEKEKLILVRTFEKYGISTAGNNLSRLDIDDQFPGEGSDSREPIIKFCHRNSLPAAQVEINAWLRIPIRRADATATDKNFQGNQRLIVNLIKALSDLVVSLANP
jgi:hypothetical protein